MECLLLRPPLLLRLPVASASLQLAWAQWLPHLLLASSSPSVASDRRLVRSPKWAQFASASAPKTVHHSSKILFRWQHLTTSCGAHGTSTPTTLTLQPAALEYLKAESTSRQSAMYCAIFVRCKPRSNASTRATLKATTSSPSAASAACSMPFAKTSIASKKRSKLIALS